MFSEQMMSYAIELSKKADYKHIRPNPFVGAVICDEQENIIGQGFHENLGGPHAEVNAIRQAMNEREHLSDCTLYVTLEPCSHHGKTPPCTDLILTSGIKKVVIGSYDPNPLVRGKQYLLENGVEVAEILLPKAQELNEVFFTNQLKKRPFVQLKSAMTLDGKIADRFGDSKWISNAESRKIVHQRLRSHTDAILTTSRTVIHDDATMNIRLSEEQVSELNVVIIDRDLNLLQNQHLSVFYQRTNSFVYLVTDKQIPEPLIQAPQVQILHIPFDEDGLVDLTILGEVLLSKNIFHLMVEGGSKLTSTLLKNQWLDELVLFVAPTLLPDVQANSLFQFQNAMSMSEAQKLNLKKVEQIQNDVLLTYSLL